MGLKNAVFRTCHTHRTDLTWPLLTSICFLQSKKLERIQLADEDQFFESLQEIFRGLDQQELNAVFQTWMPRVQKISKSNGDYVRRQKIFTSKSSARSHQTGLAHVLVD
jgi:hypothetical protein